MKKGRELSTSLRILIVEDDALIALLLEGTLQDLGHSVCAIAATKSEAVEYARDCDPDLMIVDAGLAQGNGISAVETILASRKTPFLFVTGDPQRVRSSLPDASVLLKPFFVPELIAAIDRVIAQSIFP